MLSYTCRIKDLRTWTSASEQNNATDSSAFNPVTLTIAPFCSALNGGSGWLNGERHSNQNRSQGSSLAQLDPTSRSLILAFLHIARGSPTEMSHFFPRWPRVTPDHNNTLINRPFGVRYAYMNHQETWISWGHSLSRRKELTLLYDLICFIKSGTDCVNLINVFFDIAQTELTLAWMVMVQNKGSGGSHS